MDPLEYWYTWKPVLYKSKTMHLTELQDLYYRRLIDYYMETRQPLPDHMQALANICRTTLECMTDAWRMLDAFFEHRDGKLYQTECDENLHMQDALSQKRSKNGKTAADARWKQEAEKKRKNATGNASAMPNDAKGQDQIGQERKKKEDKGEKFNLPDDVPKDAWARFDEFRKAKSGKGWTDNAKHLTVLNLRKLQAGGADMAECLDQSVMRGWTGVFAVDNDQRKGNNNGQTREQRLDAALDAGMRDIQGR